MLPLICIDVDGTLVGSAGHPTEGVWAAAEAAVARGQHLAICTGRGAFGPTWEYAERLDPAGWHVFHTGAGIVHSGTGEVMASLLPDAVLSAADQLATERGWVFERYSARSYVVNLDNELSRGHAALLGTDIRRADPAALDGPVVRAQFVIRAEEMAEALTLDLGDCELTGATSPAQPGAAFVSVTPAGVTKSSAIATIAEVLGATMADVMMVGDGQNDMDALLAVGHGVAMANAADSVKAVADYEVGDVEDDGLAEALELSAQLG